MEVEVNPIDVIQEASEVEILAGPNEVCVEASDDLVLTLDRKEYAIVGDDVYIAKTLEETPQWLEEYLDTIAGLALDGKISDINLLTQSLEDLLLALNAAKNAYTNAVITFSDAETSLNARLETLNSSLRDADATIVDLISTKVTAEQAEALSTLILDASIDGENGRLHTILGVLSGAISTESESRGFAITVLQSELQGLDEATAGAITGLETRVETTEEGVEAHAEEFTNLEASIGTDDYAGSGVNNSLSLAVGESVSMAQANFSYNVDLVLGEYTYSSGFGLATHLTTGSGIAEGDSEFWIKADKLKMTAANDRISSYNPFTVDALTGEIKFNGVVSFTNAGSGVNIANAAYSNFEHYETPVVWTFNDALASFSTAQSKFGLQSLRIEATAEESTVGLSQTNHEFNVKLTPNRKWILSFYCYLENTGSPKSVDNIAFGLGVSVDQYERLLASTSVGVWERHSLVFDFTDVNHDTIQETIIYIGNYSFDSSGSTFLHVDGVMLEEQLGDSIEPSVYRPPTPASYDLASLINLNQTTIDGGNITTGSVTAEKINTKGLVAETVSSDVISGKKIVGSTIEGAVITGAVIKASYIDLSGELAVLTNYIISVATYNGNPSFYSDAVYIEGADNYRIPTIATIMENDSEALVYAGATTLTGKMRSYNCANAGHNVKAVKVRPYFSIIEDCMVAQWDSWASSDQVFELYFNNSRLLRCTRDGSTVTLTHETGSNAFTTYPVGDGAYSVGTTDTKVLEIDSFGFRLRVTHKESCWQGCQHTITVELVAKSFTLGFDWNRSDGRGFYMTASGEALKTRLRVPNQITINNMV